MIYNAKLTIPKNVVDIINSTCQSLVEERNIVGEAATFTVDFTDGCHVDINVNVSNCYDDTDTPYVDCVLFNHDFTVEYNAEVYSGTLGIDDIAVKHGENTYRVQVTIEQCA